MSIVGPRPLLEDYLPLYTATQARRHQVRPGIVGLAVVKGRNEIPWDEKFKLDVWYVDNWSIWLDIKILLKAVQMVISGSGASQPGFATVDRFRGSKGKANNPT